MRWRFLSLILVVVAATGCSHEYRPVSGWERGVYSRASKTAFPNDVRSNPHAFEDTVVAWAGILVNAEIRAEDRDHPYVDLTVEHHYFDWVEDHGTQQEHYFLSPRGEGRFRCTWPLKKEWDLDAMRRLMAPGDMMVIYGTPRQVFGESIDLGVAMYVREIKSPWFATDILEYGQPGEPSRLLRTPLLK